MANVIGISLLDQMEVSENDRFSAVKFLSRCLNALILTSRFAKASECRVYGFHGP